MSKISRSTGQSKTMSRGDSGPKWVEMPSVNNHGIGGLEPGESYHDLGMKFPDAPVPRNKSDVIVHRAVLEDVTGISQLMDWVSDGDIVIVEMTDLMSRDMELRLAVGKIQDFEISPDFSKLNKMNPKKFWTERCDRHRTLQIASSN